MWLIWYKNCRKKLIYKKFLPIFTKLLPIKAQHEKRMTFTVVLSLSRFLLVPLKTVIVIYLKRDNASEILKYYAITFISQRMW